MTCPYYTNIHFYGGKTYYILLDVNDRFLGFYSGDIGEADLKDGQHFMKGVAKKKRWFNSDSQQKQHSDIQDVSEEV